MAVRQRQPKGTVHHSKQGCSTRAWHSAGGSSTPAPSPRWAARTTRTRARRLRASSRRWSPSCSLATTSSHATRLDASSSSSSRAGTHRAVGAVPSATSPQTRSNRLLPWRRSPSAPAPPSNRGNASDHLLMQYPTTSTPTTPHASRATRLAGAPGGRSSSARRHPVQNTGDSHVRSWLMVCDTRRLPPMANIAKPPTMPATKSDLAIMLLPIVDHQPI